MTLYDSDRCSQCGGLINRGRHPLTRRQAELMAYVAGYIAERNFAPSLNEIAARFSYRSLATVHEHLVNLERKGWIQRRYNESRAISVVGEYPRAPHDGAPA